MRVCNDSVDLHWNDIIQHVVSFFIYYSSGHQPFLSQDHFLSQNAEIYRSDFLLTSLKKRKPTQH